MHAEVSRSGLVWLCALVLLLAGCAAQVARRESPRSPRIAPNPTVATAVAEYKARDPDASFSFVGGQVDIFATTAKPRVPDYAVTVLTSLGLPTAARPVVRLLTPSQGSLRVRDLDATDRA